MYTFAVTYFDLATELIRCGTNVDLILNPQFKSGFWDTFLRDYRNVRVVVIIFLRKMNLG